MSECIYCYNEGKNGICIRGRFKCDGKHPPVICPIEESPICKGDKVKRKNGDNLIGVVQGIYCMYDGSKKGIRVAWNNNIFTTVAPHMIEKVHENKKI